MELLDHANFRARAIEKLIGDFPMAPREEIIAIYERHLSEHTTEAGKGKYSDNPRTQGYITLLAERDTKAELNRAYGTPASKRQYPSE